MPDHLPHLTLIGAGRMGTALVSGWLKSGLGGRIDIIHPRPGSQVQAWHDTGEIRLNPPQSHADILVIAVKPQVFGALADDIAKHIGPDTQVLSVMAGVSITTLQTKLGTQKVARAMPNTPGLIGKGVTILCLPDDTAPAVAKRMRDLLDPLGTVEGPIKETLLPAATAVSGCGPAYGFLLAEVMASAGIAHGLEPDMAMRLARKTVEGAGALMEAADEDPATLRQNVTSPNGVTQAALKVLMAEDALPSIFKEAIAAAIARDEALTRETQ